MSCGDIDRDQHWLVAWQHEAITLTDIDLSSEVFYGIHLRPISQVLMNLILDMCLGIALLKLLPHLPGDDLTRWSWVTHICVSKITIIGSDSGLSLTRWQPITWTNVEILLIWLLGTNFSEILIKIDTFSFKKMHLKMSSGKWRPSCLGLNVLTPHMMATGSLHSPAIHLQGSFAQDINESACCIY